jgi:exopolysaccharide production protein ExoY
MPDENHRAQAAAALAELGLVVRARIAEGGSASPEWEVETGILWSEIVQALPEPRRRHAGSDVAKRLTDLVLGSLLLVLAAPVILVLGIRVKLEDGGPMFFSHERLSRRGGLFRCWKLRTMRVTAPEELLSPAAFARYAANDFKVSNTDQRVTRVGRFLRESYLDELPQLWNVVRGDLSLVGPRPVIEDELTWWGPCAEELLSVRPGVSGAWQLTDHLPYPDRAYVELAYVRSRSLRLDLDLLVRTFLTFALRRSFVSSSLMPPATDVSARTGLQASVPQTAPPFGDAAPFGSGAVADG